MSDLIFAQSGLSFGAISTDHASTIDSPTYSKSCMVAKNVVLAPQGNATRRGGFATFGSIQDEERLRTIAYKVSYGENYVVQFFNDKIVIIRIETGAEFTIDAQPYSQQELEKIQTAGYGLTLVLCVATQPIRILRKRAGGQFTLTEFEPRFGASMSENTDLDTKITASIVEGIGNEVTLTSTKDIFLSGQQDGIWTLTEPSGSSGVYPPWEINQSITVGSFRRLDNRIYRAQSTGTCGNRPPVHNRDGLVISDGGVDWLFWNLGSGYVKLTQINSPTQAVGIIQRNLPSTLVTEGTSYWNEGAWSQYRSYPAAVAFFAGRLVFGGSDFSISTFAKRSSRDDDTMDESTQRIWASSTYDFAVFTVGVGQEGTVLNIEGQNSIIIQWLYSQTVLLVGTQAGIIPITTLLSSTISVNSDLFLEKRNIADSVGYPQPVLLNNMTFYTSFNNSSLLVTSYSRESDSYQSKRISFANAPLFNGMRLLEATQEPSNQVFCLRDSGTVSILYFNVAQEISGAYEFEIEGELINTLTIINAEVVISTKSGKMGKLDITKDPVDCLDFESICSPAKIVLLPVGLSAPGVLAGFGNKTRKKSIIVTYSRTQNFEVNGRPVIGREPHHGEEPLPRIDGYTERISLGQGNEEETVISSSERSPFTINSWVVFYEDDGV